MMYEEFEKLAGYEVSYETYSNVIEPMYMALPENITKQQFVKMLDRKAFALPTRKELMGKMKKISQHLMETCEGYTDFDAFHELEEVVKVFRDRFYSGWSYSLVTRTTGDWFCNNCPGRGCSFPVAVMFSRDRWDGKFECLEEQILTPPKGRN